MALVIPILLNCLLVIGVYFLIKYTSFKKIAYIYKQIIIGVIFGCSSAFASSFGVEWLGTIVNVRDAAPLSAGLIFGAPAGIISGFIGGMYRWFSVYWGGGLYTRVACSIATILAGFIAAGFRKLMFDNKKPNWGYGIFIAVICEVIHMILVFITNMDNSSKAFEFVRGAAIPMIIGNSVAVGCSILIVSILNYEGILRKKSESVSNTFQRWLLSCIMVAYLITSVFTFILQNRIVTVETQEMFATAINDVETDIKQKSNAKLLNIAYEVKNDYEKNPSISLNELAQKYDIKEINVVDDTGLIIDSTEDDVIKKYNMNWADQSKEFVDKLKVLDSFVQDYGPRGKDATVWRKYAAVKLQKVGFIQVGYDAEQFHETLNEFVVDITKNRHVGTRGFVAVCDNNFCMVIDNEYSGKHISSIGIIPSNEMKKGISDTKINYADIINSNNESSEEYMFVYKFIEGYCIIAAMPKTEAVFMRDASIYTSAFMQVLIFASLFIFIYILIKRIIIENLQKINGSLGQITSGDLNVVIDVRNNEEFSTLSNEINSTVSTLKSYITKEAARIDKELEYAKQIQLSALPNNFPENEQFNIFAQMIAAKEVGGDFYDFYKINDATFAFLVADVSGKGIPAAMFMMRAKTIIKDLTERGLPVNEIFTKVNEKLCVNNESGMFVTAWMGIIDIETGNIQFSNAGHNPPLLKRSNGTFEYLKTRPGLVLAGMEKVCYRSQEIKLYPGDRLFLYTDGVTEATNVNEELYGEKRLQTFMNQNAVVKSEVLLKSLKENIDVFVGEAPQFDDITMLIFDYKPMEEVSNKIYKTFSAKVDVLNDVISFVEETLASYGCTLKNQMAICVAIEEIFVNIAHYAYVGNEGDVTINISFDENNRNATFSITDTGVAFNPLDRKDPDTTLSLEEREIGGLGIFITKKTMDEIYYVYENGKNILTFVKKI